MKKGLVLCCLLIVVLSGCAAGAIADDTVYKSPSDNPQNFTLLEIPVETEGTIPFWQGDNQPWELAAADIIPLAVTQDGKTLFGIKHLYNRVEPVLQGELEQKADLYQVNLETGEMWTLADNIPFITRAVFNPQETMIAFVGGLELRIYDLVNGRFILEEPLTYDQVAFFGWSSDGSRLYTEHANLPNGTIVDLTIPELIHAYETDHRIYTKGHLGDDYYFATYSQYFTTKEEIQEHGVSERTVTVITDAQGNMIRELIPGCFRGSYQRSALVVGESGFGLYYLEDVLAEKLEPQVLTKEHVFCASFAAGGKVIYTTEVRDPARHAFKLNVYDPQRKQQQSFEVCGDAFALSPDGKTVYLASPLCEIIDVTSGELVSRLDYDVRLLSSQFPIVSPISAAVRGALNVYWQHEMTGVPDFEGLDQYFADTHQPEQWAHYDMQQFLSKESHWENDQHTRHYKLRLAVRGAHITADQASIKVHAAARNDYGYGAGEVHALELVKLNGEWKVTGFSTFPHSDEYQAAAEVLQQIAAKARQGTLFDGRFKDKEVRIGQIQFWRSSLPHLAPDPGSANYCKAYLVVTEGESDQIHKLVLKREGDQWKFESLSENTAGLH